MSEPAAFALIRNGEKRYFADRWASALLRREVLWGPEDFEEWVCQFEQLDEWAEDCDGGAVVDFDQKKLIWSGDASSYRVPRVRRVYDRLMTAAWPGFEIAVSDNGGEDLAEYLGIPIEVEDPDEEDNEEYELRSEKVEDARLDDPDDEDDEPDQEDESECHAWITLIDEDGSTRQRRLEELTLDLLKGEAHAFDAVAKLPPATIPKEAQVSEGLIINPSKKTAQVWGSGELLSKMKSVGKLWKGWELRWIKNGYAQQCSVSRTEGVPMSEVDALAKILPLVLSTEQFNLGSVLGMIGGGVNRFAMKATGCLVVVICLPLVLFGLFSGAWTSVLYAIGGTVAVVVGLYLLILYRIRKAFRNKVPRQEGEAETRVAGPQDTDARKERIDKLLAAASLPRLAEVEPYFPDASGLELLAE